MVLSPRIEAKDPRAPAAELLCDALAEVLSKDAGLKVVDRGQIKRILEEHKNRLRSGEGAAQPKPLIAYDMMARLTFDTVRPVPRVIIEFIELSTGNVLETEGFDWHPQPGKRQVARMAQLARSAARKAAGGARSRKLKVRILGVANASSTPRAAPFAEDFAQMLERVVESNPGCQLVRHIEAATASEESLLILMGLSKLGGGREFTPAADAMLEASIREVDPEGKDFQHTPLEVKFRATAAGRRGGKWKTFTGAVDKWPGVSAKARTEAAKAIAHMVPEHRGPAPQAAVKLTDDMAQRRAQARAELTAALKATYKGSVVERWKAMLEHVAAARKLDPGYEEAAYAYAMISNNRLPGYQGSRTLGLQAGQLDRMAGLAEGLKYLDRFKVSFEHRRKILYLTAPCVHRTIGTKRVTEILDDPSRITAAELRLIDALKQHTDAAMRDFPPALFSVTTIPLIGIGMKRAGVPASQRWNYVQRVLKRCEEGPAANYKGLPAGKDYVWRNYWGALRLAIMEKESDRAVALLDKLLAAAPKNNPGFQKYTMRQIRSMVQASKDQRLIDKVGAGPPKFKRRPAWMGSFVGLDTPRISVFDTPKKVAPLKVTRLAVSYKPADPKSKPAFLPLLRTNSRLYVLVIDLTPSAQKYIGEGSAQGWMHNHASDRMGDEHVAFLELDAGGKARGDLHVLDMPKLDRRAGIRNAVQMAGKVYFATRWCGILELTERSGKWRVIGPAEGLPVKRVCSLVLLDEKTILGNGGQKRVDNVVFFTFDTERHFKLLKTNKRFGGGELSAAWRYDGKIMAFLPFGIRTDLGGPNEKKSYNRLSWGAGVTQTIADRHWVFGYNGLVAVHDSGKVVRIWRRWEWNHTKADWGRGGWSNLSLCGMALRGDISMHCDGRYESLTNDENHLFLYRHGTNPKGRREVMLCYEPASDTWYGPLNLAWPPWLIVGAKDGLWIADRFGLSYMETADFKAAATAARRVITSADLRKRVEELYRALPPFELAKVYLARKKLAKVTALLEPILKKKPDDPEALLMMGFAKETLARKPRRPLHGTRS